MRQEIKSRSVEQGQALVEFALVAFLLFFIVISVFDFGYAVFTKNMLSNAAREGARTGIIMANTDAAIRTRVRAAAPGLTLTDAQIGITPTMRKNGDPITVTLTYTYIPITPVLAKFVGDGMVLSASSAMIVEGVSP